MKKTIGLTILILTLAGSVLRAGELAPELRAKMKATSGDSLIKVWIKLPRTEQPQQLKSSVNSTAKTRAGRYAEAYNRLKSAHQNSQKDLLGRLNQLKQSGKCQSLKPSWLANLIEAEISSSELETIAARTDVEIVYPVPKLTLIEPIVPSPTQSESGQAGVEPNLTYIKAPQAWAAGFTGAGRIICSFDTGIDGYHPAIINNWKGLDGDSAAAWFDPRDREPFPHPVLDDNHGTHVMGILVGHDDNTGDTVGVALEAKWISAGVLDIAGASYIDAFEWAADPDGDPNSVDDVPDVINNSWGIKTIGCQDVFYDIIENLEALGIVVVFAAGNTGPGAQSIANPANRALDSIDCFAIGNCNTNVPPSAVTSSSRGPSPCNGAIKPNVSAPGQSIRSSTLNGFYTQLTGTSMATPHVAGLVALLRQKNPNATVDEIKTAILTTTQTFGLSLPDNNLGWGVIDCMAALNSISDVNTLPNVRVFAFDHNAITPGSTVTGSLVLQNLGTAIGPVTATIIGTSPYLSISDGTASFGAIAANDTTRAGDQMQVAVNSLIAEGTVISLDMRITNGGTYDDTVKIHFLVEPANERSFVTHDNGNVEFSVTNFGTYGLGFGSFFPAGGAGFDVSGAGNDLFECGLIVGYDSLHISDGVRNSIGEPDGDFRVTPGGNIKINVAGAGTAQKSSSIFDDSRAEHPIGLRIKQLSYSFSEPLYDDFIILRYIITNTNPFSVNDIYVGLYLDWDILPLFFNNAGGYDAGSQLLWCAYNNSGTFSNFRGAIVLDGLIAGALTAQANIAYYDEGLRDKEKDSVLGIGFTSASDYVNAQKDLLQVISAGPINLSAGDTEIVAFAILSGANFTSIDNNSFFAQLIYDSLINNCCVNLTGDANGDGNDGNIVDLNFMINRVFRFGPLPDCLPEGDVNSDGFSTNVLDLNILVNRIFRFGPPLIPCAGY